MASTNSNNADAFRLMEPFYDWWRNYAQQVNNDTEVLLKHLREGSSLPELHQSWLAALTQSLDSYMRSPAFLESMKNNLQTAIQAREQINDASQEVARNAQIPTLNDISGLFERLKSVEAEVIRRLDRIEKRLQAMEEKA
jgi:methyl-accepting chemotaxis protein